MLLHPTTEGLFERKLHLAQAVTPDLIADVIAQACPRLVAITGGPRRIAGLVERQAWTDAALALVELELPQWKLRRLIYDDAAWHCSLSREPGLPTWLDDGVEGHHEVLALAILTALVEVRRDAGMAGDAERFPDFLTGRLDGTPKVPLTAG